MISLPPELYARVERQAKVFGLSFPEYVRFLMIQDIRDEPVEMVDEETEERIGQALEAHKAGRTVSFEPGEEFSLEKLQEKFRALDYV